jgi:hypothetical protein
MEVLKQKDIEVSYQTPKMESNILPSSNGSMMPNGSFVSPNYAPKTGGWKLNNTGDVEFLSGIKVTNVITATKFRKLLTEPNSGISIWLSIDGTTPDGALTGVQGDICLNGPSGQLFYCAANGLNDWLSTV